MLNHEPIPEADLREIRLLDEIDSLREGLRKSIILGIDVNDPLIMHKSGETITSVFREGVPEHNARIDALLGEGGEDVTTPR